MINEQLKYLEGISQHYLVKRCRGVTAVDFEAMESSLGTALPATYKALLIDHGIIYVDASGSGDPVVSSAHAEKHLVDVERREVGVGYWFSFLWPSQALTVTQDLRTAVAEDFEDEQVAQELERAIAFQQGYGDYAYYLFVADTTGQVSIKYFDGSEGDATLTHTSGDFASHLGEYIARWRQVRRL